MLSEFHRYDVQQALFLSMMYRPDTVTTVRDSEAGNWFVPHYTRAELTHFHAGSVGRCFVTVTA